MALLPLLALLALNHGSYKQLFQSLAFYWREIPQLQL